MDASSLYLLAMVGAFAGFGLAMVNSFKRVVSPGLVLAYAGVEGLFVGAFSKVVEAQFGGSNGTGGLVMGAVVGTFAAVGRHPRGVQVLQHPGHPDSSASGSSARCSASSPCRCSTSCCGFFGASFGFNGFGGMGLLSSVIGLGLGVLMLILDFDFVERGIEAGLPERESWRAAFGLTVTIIWIYIELLRILAILRGD